MAETRPAPGSGAHMSLRIGKAITLDAQISAGGLLAVGALVFGALIGSAAIVFTATRRDRAKPKLLRDER